VIFKDDLEKIFGKRPFDKEKEEGKPVKEKNTLAEEKKKTANGQEVKPSEDKSTDGEEELTENDSVNK